MQEPRLLVGLKHGDTEAFSLLFKAYYKDLVMFAGTYVAERTVCEDIVQTTFMKLWDDHAELHITTSLKSYLLAAVRNSCLDELRHRRIIHEHEAYAAGSAPPNDTATEDYVLYSDLRQHIDDALRQLPPAYGQAFRMNRFEGLKYREIAARLHVSERTVEVRIGKALLLLREQLKDLFG